MGSGGRDWRDCRLGIFGWGCCVLWRLWVVCLIINLRYGGEEKELSEDAQKWSRETNLAWQIAAETA